MPDETIHDPLPLESCQAAFLRALNGRSNVYVSGSPEDLAYLYGLEVLQAGGGESPVTHSHLRALGQTLLLIARRLRTGLSKRSRDSRVPFAIPAFLRQT